MWGFLPPELTAWNRKEYFVLSFLALCPHPCGHNSHSHHDETPESSEKRSLGKEDSMKRVGPGPGLWEGSVSGHRESWELRHSARLSVLDSARRRPPRSLPGHPHTNPVGHHQTKTATGWLFRQRGARAQTPQVSLSSWAWRRRVPGSLCLDAGRGQQLRVWTGRATSGATKTERPKGTPPSQGLGGRYSQASGGPQRHRSSAEPKGWRRTQSKTLARDVTKTCSD